ncbi:hypothetical protein P171DRAFT_36974 [Karstenula rhodostoma CBS 690.94]|uniref:Uncharacterized protein n=1 Tax=Karstenula rhodostoma CBS 690.94 TaxID=1392251 RepID=A0A9P4PFX8_9PLEO|nr:hypothetical protein P171DRAFT_36974 [Karstenula rhodostoma CBS 690.94]
MAFTDSFIWRAKASPVLTATLIPLTSADLTSSHLLRLWCFGSVLGSRGASVILWRSCVFITIDIQVVLDRVQGWMPALKCRTATYQQSHTAC